MESVILRDHNKYKNNLNQVFQDFFMFNVYKAVVWIIVATVLSLVLTVSYSNNDFVFSILSITFISIADSITAPFIIYFSSKFNQRLVTKISIIRSIFNVAILLGLFIYPYLWFIAMKDFIVSSTFIAVWFYIAFNKIGFRPAFKAPDMQFIKKVFVTYSMWTHINGMVTNFVYKSDTFFLSLFASLTMVGDYNIALNSANIANIVPSILGYQNSVALSNARDNTHALKITNGFIRISLLISVCTIVVFYFCGYYYLSILTRSNNNAETYVYMMCIVVGITIVKTIASPLVSYITILGKVKRMVQFVSLPLGIVTVLSYFVGSFMAGAKGVALANIIIAVIWLVLLVVYLESMQKNLSVRLIWK